MATADNTTNPSAQPAPAIDRERPTLPARKPIARDAAFKTLDAIEGVLDQMGRTQQ